MFITSTATAFHVDVNEDAMQVIATAHRSWIGSTGEEQQQNLVFRLLYKAPKKAALPEIVKGDRIAFTGTFTGDCYKKNGNYVINGPNITEKDGEPRTTFEVECDELSFSGKSAKDTDYQDVTKVILWGHLGNDADMRYTPSGTAVANTSIAVNQMLFENEERKKLTIWWRLATWAKSAETALKWWHKGKALIVWGTLVSDKTGGCPVWKTNAGENRASYQLSVTGWQFAPGSRGSNGDSSPLPDDSYAIETSKDEEIPF